jgi:hypothetical protein
VIRSSTIRTEVQKEWNGVRAFQSRIQAHLNAPSGIGTAGATHQLRNISHNLTLLFAFSVLEKTLKQFRDEGLFLEKTNGLKKLMLASKKILPWQDFELIDTAREDRNRVAHQQKILERAECWKYIDGIENELVSWNVVLNPKQFKH